MEKIKIFLLAHFEKIIVLSILIGIIIIHYLVSYKMAFLNFFYLPIIIAGYYLGKRMAVLTAVLCIAVVILFLILFPSSFLITEMGKTGVIVSLTAWSCFLILTSAALGHLYEEKEKQIKNLKSAYVGILEILSKYLETADRYTKGHSLRVAHLSEDIARTMELSKYEIENIRAATLSTTEKELMDSHSEKGAKILSLVGGVLREAVPIVLAHHKYYFEAKKSSSEDRKEIPIGAAIIAVADAYDSIITDRPYRAGKPPWKAIEEIQKDSGKQFHPEVVKAFKQVLIADEKYRKEES